jgi:hypothetical protein
VSQYFGCYRGVCTTNNDPEKRMRVKVQVPLLLGGHETDWAWPCVVPGWNREVLRPHADHVFTDDDTGDNAGGSHTETLVHTENHTRWQRTPNPGEIVWVMFEAGDITKPVWMGVGA